MRHAIRAGHPAFTLLASTLLALGAAHGQGLQRPYENAKLSVSYRIPQDLDQIPVNAGSGEPHLADKWSAIKKPLYGRHGAYEWQAEVRMFDLSVPEDEEEEAEGKEGKEPPQERPAPETLKEAIERFNTYRNYEAWLDEYERRAGFAKRGDKRKQRRGAKLPYRYYEFVETGQATWVTCAACYTLDDREIVISIYFPDEMRKKLLPTVMASLESLEVIESAGGSVNLKKVRGYRYANTPAREKALADAMVRTQAVQGWDLFATEHFIVVYSYEDNPGRKRDRAAYAVKIARLMDEMSEEYRKILPAYEGMQREWSVLRICKNYDEFSKYGDTRPGVAGWFNRLSKELVVFDMPKAVGMATESVAYHEGFHQYADAWFGDEAEIHTWFNEGFAEYFGSMGRVGRSWVPGKVQDRRDTIQSLVERKATIAFSEITTWSQQRFYSGNAADHYAQAWAMIDFMTRGTKSPYWKSDWEKVLPTYIKTLREGKDQEKALAAAFQGFDWPAFEEAFAGYVRRGL